MEVFMVNWAGSGSMNMEVEMPTSTGNTYTQQVDRFVLNSTIQPEVKLFRMTKGNSSDIIQLFIYRYNFVTKDLYEVRRNISYDCSAGTFLSALVAFDIYSSGYQITVTKRYIDVSGAEVAT